MAEAMCKIVVVLVVLGSLSNTIDSLYKKRRLSYRGERSEMVAEEFK